MNKTTAIILAAGAGTRMKSDIPKVLHKVGSDTILGKVVLNLKRTGIRDIITVVGYKAAKIQELFENDVRFTVQEELLGSGDAVRGAMNRLEEKTENIVITCGDTPLISSDTFKKVIRKHIEEKASCTLLTCKTEDAFSYGRIVRDSKGKIEKIVEEKDLLEDQKNIKEINTGTYCFARKELEKFIKEIKKNDKKREFYLTDIVDIFRKNGEKITSTECSYQESIGVNSRKELAVVNMIIKSSTLDRLMSAGVTVVDPETTYISEKAEIEKDTIIISNTVIEEDVIVGGKCKIGPFARLRPGTRIADEVEIGNFVEICRTKVGKRTRIKHHAYIGDTAVGSDVNIGAGVITANYDGEKKNRTVIEDGAFIGVGTMLIAPVTIGKNAKVGAGSVITKNKDVPAGETVIGVPAKPMKK